MNNQDSQFNRRLVLLVLASLTIFAVAVVLRLGLDATPYDTTDSAGRSMGFNDPLHGEHFLIILRNFNPAAFLRPECFYEWMLLAAHIVAACLLVNSSRVSSRLTRWYFVVQGAIFPLGFIALPFLPFLVANFFTGRMDREGFVDIPFILAVTHPVWLVTSLIIAFRLRGSALGLSRVWSALSQAARAAVRTFTHAVR